MLSLIDPCSGPLGAYVRGWGQEAAQRRRSPCRQELGRRHPVLCRSQEPVEGHQCLEYSVPKTPKKANEVDAWQLCGGGLQAENKVGDSTCSAVVRWPRPTSPTWMADRELSTPDNGNKGKERW